MLCKYPEVQEKAAKEVREATNTKTISSMQFSQKLSDFILQFLW
jgi:hypothetical protein